MLDIIGSHYLFLALAAAGAFVLVLGTASIGDALRNR